MKKNKIIRVGYLFRTGGVAITRRNTVTPRIYHPRPVVIEWLTKVLNGNRCNAMTVHGGGWVVFL